jgi:hypothetical protein
MTPSIERDSMNAFVRPARHVFLPIDEIDHSHTIRPYNATVVAELAQSIRAIGLQTPLTCVIRSPLGWSSYADFTERSPRVMNGG